MLSQGCKRFVRCRNWAQESQPGCVTILDDISDLQREIFTCFADCECVDVEIAMKTFEEGKLWLEIGTFDPTKTITCSRTLQCHLMSKLPRAVWVIQLIWSTNSRYRLAISMSLQNVARFRSPCAICRSTT
jgi:hypothetical protein